MSPCAATSRRTPRRGGGGAADEPTRGRPFAAGAAAGAVTTGRPIVPFVIPTSLGFSWQKKDALAGDPFRSAARSAVAVRAAGRGPRLGGVVAHELADFLHHLRAQRVVHPASRAAVVYQACIPQDLQVERQPRLRGADRALELAHAALAAHEELHHAEARLVRECVEPARQAAQIRGLRFHTGMIYQETLVRQGDEKTGAAWSLRESRGEVPRTHLCR